MLALFKTCRKGAAAVEAALVFPILVGLMLGAIEISFILYTSNTLQSAAREVTRQVAINYISPAAAEGAIKGHLPNWAANSATVSVSQSAPADPNNNLITVSVSLPAHLATPIHVFAAFAGGLTLSSSVTMKQEDPLWKQGHPL